MSTPTTSSSSQPKKEEQDDLISFVTDIPVDKNSKLEMELDSYDKLKQSILKLGENSQQQVVPYQLPFTSQPYYGQLNVYGSNYSMPKIGFENFLSQQSTYYTGTYQNSMSQQIALQTVQPSAQISAAHLYSSPTTSSAMSIKSNSIKAPPKLVEYDKGINRPKSDKSDLINLDISDEATSFANILQTFDPLIKHSINEEASNAYYSDQDPFDYIYSGNSQCSDPLYEFVNRNEKLTSLKSQGEMYYECTTSAAELNQPPPLPPRNSSQQTHDIQYPKKLYENIIEKTAFDKDSMAFYKMVKDLRSKYLFDDNNSNVGHIKVATLESSYLNVSSIKILVYPSYECFKGDKKTLALLTRNNNSNETYNRLENYLPPLVFTCNVKSTVIHIIMQVLAMLENEEIIQSSPESFVLKTIGSDEWLSDTDVTLSHLQYVQTSISLEKDVQFALYPRQEKHLKIIARTEIDDKRDRELKIENILPKDPITSISYESLIILLETLEMEIDKVQTQSANAPNTHISFNSSGN